MLAVCLLAPWLIGLTLRSASRGQRWRAYAAALTLGLLTQALFVPLDARRQDSLLARHEGGHAEFHVVALQHRGSLLSTLRNYNEQAETRQLGVFPPSKPPGALAAYAAMDALGSGPLAGHLEPLRALAQRNPQVAAVEDGFVVSALLFPLFTALLAPLALALGVRLHGAEATGYALTTPHAGLRAGAAAAVLTATSPALLLITYHLDGACYPLFALLTLLLLSAAMQTHTTRGGGVLAARVLGLGTLAGAALTCGLYMSFSLIPALGLALGVTVALGLATPHRARPLRRAVLALIGFTLGVFGVMALLIVTLDYHPLGRFEAAMAYHSRWKAAVPSGPWRGAALLEWSLYAGFPLVALLLFRAARSFGHLREARRSAATLLPLGVVALLLALSVLSGTSEVARMWLFMVPVAALAAVSAPLDTRVFSTLATTQLVLALVMKANQAW
jgi:hypothetical protein